MTLTRFDICEKEETSRFRVLVSRAELEKAEQAVRRLWSIGGHARASDPVVRALTSFSEGHWYVWAKDDPWAGLRESNAAQRDFEEAGHWRGVTLAGVVVGMNLWLLGSL